MNTFDYDLKEGQKAEKLFVLNVKDKCDSEFTFNTSTGLTGLRLYDIHNITKDITYEIKWDKKSSLTGNVCIEFKALDYSESDYYVFLIRNHFYMIPTKDLRELVKTDLGRITHLKNDVNHLLYIIKIEIFKTKCNYIFKNTYLLKNL